MKNNVVLSDYKKIEYEVERVLASSPSYTHQILEDVLMERRNSLAGSIIDYINRNPIDGEHDFVGFLYQKIESIKNKKSKGQYFTPPKIVNHILDQIIADNTDFRNVKILDPACGSGQFLMGAFSKLLSVYLANGYDAESASKLILKNNLFGYDLDPNAVEITKYNLIKMSFLTDPILNIHEVDFLKKSFLENFSEGKHEIDNLSFDYIVGNPPWGSKLSAQEKKYFRNNYFSAKSGINTFTLFIERSLEMLKDNGKLGFLIPEAYLNIKAHNNSRIKVLENCKIGEIALWGDQFKNVYAPAVSIILQESQSHKERHQNIVKICDGKSLKDNTRTLVPQDHYYNTYQNIFNVNYSKKAVNIINTIENQDCFYLKDNAKFFLGIVTGNNPKYISKEQNENTPDPIIIGKDLKPYEVNFSGNFFKYDSNVLQQTAPEDLYKAKDKIIYKFIGKKLSFAIEENGFYTLNNVNGFIPDDSIIDKYALVGVLNSTVVQYYYEKNFFTLKVLRNNLEKLPLIELSKDSERKISKYAKDIIESTLLSERKRIKENIDDILLHEYNLQDKEGYRMWEEVKTNNNQSILPGI